MRFVTGTLRNPSSRTRVSVALIALSSIFVLSPPTHGQEDQRPSFAGVWSTNSLDTLANPSWDIEGQFSCRCASESYEHLRSLLYEPSNDHFSARDIIEELEAHTDRVIAERLTDTGRELGMNFDLADDPAIQCERFGVFRTILHSDPIEFVEYDDRIIIKGEDLTIERTVYIDGRGHPDGGEKTTAGHSIGWYEGQTLVVETVDMTGGLVDDQLALHSSDQARSLERYAVRPNGRILDTSLTLYDPVMLRAPLTIERPRVLAPEVQLEPAPCEVISGQF